MGTKFLFKRFFLTESVSAEQDMAHDTESEFLFRTKHINGDSTRIEWDKFLVDSIVCKYTLFLFLPRRGLLGDTPSGILLPENLSNTVVGALRGGVATMSPFSNSELYQVVLLIRALALNSKVCRMFANACIGPEILDSNNSCEQPSLE